MQSEQSWQISEIQVMIGQSFREQAKRNELEPKELQWMNAELGIIQKRSDMERPDWRIGVLVWKPHKTLTDKPQNIRSLSHVLVSKLTKLTASRRKAKLLRGIWSLDSTNKARQADHEVKTSFPTVADSNEEIAGRSVTPSSGNPLFRRRAHPYIPIYSTCQVHDINQCFSHQIGPPFNFFHLSILIF